jgi:uncharacterized membrane protein (Fun14 family)
MVDTSTRNRMMDYSSFVAPGTISFVAGGAVGFAAKKVLKLVAVVGGIAVAGLGALEYSKVASVNWTLVKGGAINASHWMYHQAMGVEHHLTGVMNSGSTVVMGGGFLGGILLGWKAAG